MPGSRGRPTTGLRDTPEQESPHLAAKLTRFSPLPAPGPNPSCRTGRGLLKSATPKCAPFAPRQVAGGRITGHTLRCRRKSGTATSAAIDRSRAAHGGSRNVTPRLPVFHLACPRWLVGSRRCPSTAHCVAGATGAGRTCSVRRRRYVSRSGELWRTGRKRNDLEHHRCPGAQRWTCLGPGVRPERGDGTVPQRLLAAVCRCRGGVSCAGS